MTPEDLRALGLSIADVVTSLDAAEAATVAVQAERDAALATIDLLETEVSDLQAYKDAHPDAQPAPDPPPPPPAPVPEVLEFSDFSTQSAGIYTSTGLTGKGSGVTTYRMKAGSNTKPAGSLYALVRCAPSTRVALSGVHARGDLPVQRPAAVDHRPALRHGVLRPHDGPLFGIHRFADRAAGGPERHHHRQRLHRLPRRRRDAGYRLRRLTLGVRTTTASVPTSQQYTVELHRQTVAPAGTGLAAAVVGQALETWVPADPTVGLIATTATTIGTTGPTLTAVPIKTLTLNTQTGWDYPFEFLEELVCGTGTANGIAFVNIGNTLPAGHLITVDCEWEV
jgi:hypothetical protein